MLKKRLVGVVTVKDGWAVQSFGYQRYLPLGKPECLVENLDRWGADEILVQVIDRSTEKRGPDFKLLERLGSLGLETPLIYAGGIRSVSDGVRLIQQGADRLVVDALLHDDLSAVRGLSERLGAQAIIASMPLSYKNDSLEWFDYRIRQTTPVPAKIVEIMSAGVISEVLVIDWEHEGQPRAFNKRLIDEAPFPGTSIIGFGGLSECSQMNEMLQSSRVTAVAVGNFLAYREHAIQKYKELLAGMPLRLPVYESSRSLIADV